MQVLGSIFDLIWVIWNDVLPTEFYFTTETFALFGGQAVYYMGYYGYGASITSLDNRAALLARYDGLEQGGMLLGTLLSPLAFQVIGYLGCYLVKLVLFILALTYLIIFVREPIKSPKKVASENRPSKPFFGFFKKYLIQPFLQILNTIFQKRPRGLRKLLFVQLFVYALYWFLVDQNEQMQLYFLHIIPDFSSSDFSLYVAFIKVVSMISLLLVLPIMSKVFKWHDALIVTIVTFSYTLGHLLEAFASKMWQIYITEAISMMRICQYSLAR
jgi:hypothetical protein